VNFSNSSTFSFSRLSRVLSFSFSGSASLSLLASQSLPLAISPRRLVDIELLSDVGSGIYTSIWSNDDVRMINGAEYIENLSDSGPLLIYNPGICSGDIVLASNTLLALDNQFILYCMKSGA